MKREPVLLVMAAGMGSRYGGLKQIDPVTPQREIILDFSLYDAIRAGFKKAVFIIREETLADFKELLDKGAAKNIEVEYVFQKKENIPEGYALPEDRVKPWGTGHAILSAYEKIKGPFAVINADDYYGPQAFEKIHAFLADERDDSEFAMVAYSLKNTVTENGSVSRGICTVEKNRLKDIVERKTIEKKGDKIFYKEGDDWKELESETPVSMNFWGYSPLIMKELQKEFPKFLNRVLKKDPLKGEFLIPEITDRLIKRGEATCEVLKSADKWHGVTYKEDREMVSEAMTALKVKNIYPEKLWK